MKITKWIKSLIYVVKDYAPRIAELEAGIRDARKRSAEAYTIAESSERRVSKAVQVIIDRTTVNADVAYSDRGRSWIVIIGRYRNNDYVECHAVTDAYIDPLIQELQELRKHGRIDRVDAPPYGKQVIERAMGRGRI